MSKLAICLLGSFGILLMFAIIIIITAILDYYEEHGRPQIKRSIKKMFKKFKDWLIKLGIKGILLKKGREEAIKLINKLFDKLENKKN